MGFNIVGVGPGDSELLTVKAVRLIKEADIIITPVKKEGSTNSTALSIAKPYVNNMDKVQYYYFPMVMDFANDLETVALFKLYGELINNYIDNGHDVVFLTLGDPSVYSTFSYIAQYISSVNYVPGIASFLHGAALSRIPLCMGDESLGIISMTDSEAQIRSAFKLHKNIVVMKVCSNQPLLKDILSSSSRDFIFMSNLGLENESTTKDISILDSKMPYFTIGIIK